MDTKHNTLKDRLRAARRTSGLSASQLSFKSGVPEQTIRQWEYGLRTTPKAEALAKVARALGVSVEQLVGLDE
jgi:transcriptional regulator with XRE-family HTH domain